MLDCLKDSFFFFFGSLLSFWGSDGNFEKEEEIEVRFEQRQGRMRRGGVAKRGENETEKR